MSRLQKATGRSREPRFDCGPSSCRTGAPASLSDILGTLNLPTVEGATRLHDSIPSVQSSLPPALDRPDDPNSLLLAAKALVFCGFPYKRSPLTTIPREAQLGSDTHLTVYFSTTEPDVPIPFGADRALLAWITTLTYDTGFVNFASLTDFFEAFQLARSGVQYRRFEERLQRLLSLSMTLLLRTPTGTARFNMRPIQRAYTSRDGAEARRLLATENRSQLSFLPVDLKRYGIVLDPAFHDYLRNSPVVLPLSPSDAQVSQPSPLLGRCVLPPLPMLVGCDSISDQLAAHPPATRKHRPARSAACFHFELRRRGDPLRLPRFPRASRKGDARSPGRTLAVAPGTLSALMVVFWGRQRGQRQFAAGYLHVRRQKLASSEHRTRWLDSPIRGYP